MEPICDSCISITMIIGDKLRIHIGKWQDLKGIKGWEVDTRSAGLELGLKYAEPGSNLASRSTQKMESPHTASKLSKNQNVFVKIQRGHLRLEEVTHFLALDFLSVM